MILSFLLSALVLCAAGCGASRPPFRSSWTGGTSSRNASSAGAVRLGFHISYESTTPATFARHFLPPGMAPAVFGDFMPIGSSFDAQYFVKKAKMVAEVAPFVWNGTAHERMVYSVAIEPTEGLEAVTDASLRALTGAVVDAEEAGVQVVIRYGHEMSGGWYVWGKKPKEYVASYRRVASAIRAASPRTLLLWSPGSDNCTWYGPNKTTADPWGEYWPGEDVVDLVGLSLYFFGKNWPKPGNEMPDGDDFQRWVSGEPSCGNPNFDFYSRFAARYGKPFVVSETAAAFRLPLSQSSRTTRASTTTSAAPTPAWTPVPAESELAMKSAWWRQVYSPATLLRYPLLWGIVWFEHLKYELEEWRDFRSVTHGALVRETVGEWDEATLATLGTSEVAKRFREEVLGWNALVFGAP
ncbi:glycoside hydrolase superfamily [Hyaloraphidium curvatum]|nr:glycoside hydrolase superfamily [Hyaloraphidium curvatum]